MKRLLLALLVFTLGPLRAAETRDAARLRLPWDALKSVLRIDRDDVRLSAAEFDALAKLTTPAVRPAARFVEGDVVLSRAEFTRLVQSLVPPAPEPAGVYLPKAVYRGRRIGNGAQFSVALQLEVARRPERPLSVDVFPAYAAFEEIRLDGRPARAEIVNGRLKILVDAAGSHRVDLRFTAPAPEADAAQTLSVPIARTPITDWSLEVPERNVDIAVSPALHRELETTPTGTRVRALLPPTDRATATWNPLTPDTAKGPAQIYATVDHLLSVEDDALRVTGLVHLEVLQNTINRCVLELPEGFAVLNVTGDGVGDWQEEPGRPATLTVPFRSARRGSLGFEVVLERVLPSEKSTTTLTGLLVRNALRQRGALGLELKSDAELPAPETEGLEPQDPFRELPPSLAARSARLVFGYRYRRPPFALRVALARHEAMNVVAAAIDRADATTVLRPDGKRVHRVAYQLRPSSKQFLEFQLPDGARLWNAFVDGAPVKPVQGASGTVLLPLLRSGRGDLFPVEFVYFENAPAWGWFGRETLRLPTPDVLIGRLQWRVIVPPDRSVRYFGRDFETVADASAPGSPAAARPFAPARAKAILGGTKDRGDREEFAARSLNAANRGFDAVEPSEALPETEGSVAGDEALARMPEAAPAIDDKQEWKAKSDASAVAGVLPVRVGVPEIGTPALFARTLPEPGALLSLPIYHGAHGLGSVLRWIALLVLITALRVYRSSIVRLASPLVRAAKHSGGRIPWSDPGFQTLGTAVAALSAAAVAPFLFYLVLPAFAAAAGRWILSALPQGDDR